MQAARPNQKQYPRPLGAAETKITIALA